MISATQIPFARLAGFTARVVELLEAVEADKDETERRRLKSGSPASSDTGSPASSSAPPEKRNAIASRRPGGVRFRNVTVYSPDGRLLVKDVDFDLAPGENLFVTGANGAGKTSLFRVLAGLWAPASGAVENPGEDPSPVSVEGSPRVFYVPQRPYLVSGTLRDQVTYPLPGAKAHDARVLEALSMVNLLKLAEGDLGLDRAPHDWTDVLSGGEKQRVGLARLYFRIFTGRGTPFWTRRRRRSTRTRRGCSTRSSGSSGSPRFPSRTARSCGSSTTSTSTSTQTGREGGLKDMKDTAR